MIFFNISLTLHLGIILVNNQLDALFLCIHLFHFSTCFEQPSAHHQENQLYQCIKNRHIGQSPTQSNIQCIPDDALIQLILLMMSAVTLETCREMK